jgi:hypothetical protein
VIGPRVSRRGGVLATALVSLALVAAGCGGSKSPSVANLGTTASSSAASTNATESTAGVATSHSGAPGREGLASCLTGHGFQAAVGSAAAAAMSSVSIGGVVVSGNADPNSPQFQAALRACRKYLPAGPPPLSQAEQAAAVKAMVAFTSCMRTHGVPSFPDPNSQGLIPLAAMNGIDPSSPLVLTAFKGCESLEPTVGPRIEFEAGGNIAERTR